MSASVRPATGDDVGALGRLLGDCVRDGASVGYLADVDVATSEAFWRARLADPDALVLVADLDDRVDGRVVGTVTLLPAPMPNGRHRAEVSKLLVAPAARGRGLARQLLRALEAEALQRGCWLLLLDTQTGSAAEGLYAADGWAVTGMLPDHAATPDGVLRPTTFMSKRLARPGH
jgi:GNAT superfamily N-acetyltransferase